ncbi:Stp1/IreP family PP2C-type Ser/Thr phosphatase [Bacillus sp. HMF5848]|uniref:Stp1/IreP family PP2C-type Ser/Thr phosphatase n=1 Tax=Bacillus sp. HMF5848 TaxID=2495421 RepID=UPI000F7998E9|nr:Stp1/IreP family PP2C-type Ser/Thr phosphatase [Bacillus sp. HMF5848]RSK26980.1 Stp1/IreP family PP2C-type Ser/Thr phosphatase [Bacillus sp. HMF5848]
MEFAYKTDKGKVRQLNEDNGGVFLNDNKQLLAIVADGMGGHKAGDVASSIVISLLQKKWSKQSPIQTADEAESWLEETIQLANEAVYEQAEQNEECSGMGTTLVAAICTDTFTTIAHIGDSRCYALTDLDFSQLTEDHSYVNELVRSGQISREDAEHHPRKNVILRALGTQMKVNIDMKTIILEEHDQLLLCTDGLCNKVHDQELADVLRNSNQAINEKANYLIDLANERGGEDNITLAIVNYGGESGGSQC